MLALLLGECCTITSPQSCPSDYGRLFYTFYAFSYLRIVQPKVKLLFSHSQCRSKPI